jgi:hypothetical protein
MAKLVELDGQGFYIGDDGTPVPLSPSEYARQQIYQNQIQGLSGSQRFMAGAGKYFSDLGQGFKQLVGGPEWQQEAQQAKAETAQRYQSMQDYGGLSAELGQFVAPALTAAIPGGLKTQMTIGGLQAAAETPDRPLTSAAIGVGTTLGGDLAADAVGRIGRQLTAKRRELSPDPFYRETIEAGEAAGLRFTPGQRAGNPARIRMERELAKNPRYAGLDMDRFLNNQARLNDLAAETLGLPPTGRVTGPMRGQAKKAVSDAYDAIARESAPVQLLPDEFGQAATELVSTDPGQAWFNSMTKRFPEVFGEEAGPMTGEQFNRLRNWVAKESRIPNNITSGVSDDMQGIMRALDDSLEAANITNPQLLENVRTARDKWRSLLVIENAQRGAEAAAAGNLSPVSAYNALRKYDKGGLFRGRSRGEFSDAVQAMAMLGDTVPPPRPSGDPSLLSGPGAWLKETFWTGPAVENYMQGGNLGAMMLGIAEPGAAQPLLDRAGIGVARGLMAPENENYVERRD